MGYGNRSDRIALALRILSPREVPRYMMPVQPPSVGALPNSRGIVAAGYVKTPHLSVRESTDRRAGREHAFCVVWTIPMSNERRPKTGDDQAAPLAVFYVVETTGQVIGARHHRVCSHLFEASFQAQTELARLELANASGAFSIWKGTTYIEPAEWLYDLIMADGTVIPARRGHLVSGRHARPDARGARMTKK